MTTLDQDLKIAELIKAVESIEDMLRQAKKGFHNVNQWNEGLSDYGYDTDDSYNDLIGQAFENLKTLIKKRKTNDHP